MELDIDHQCMEEQDIIIRLMVQEKSSSTEVTELKTKQINQNHKKPKTKPTKQTKRQLKKPNPMHKITTKAQWRKEIIDAIRNKSIGRKDQKTESFAERTRKR